MFLLIRTYGFQKREKPAISLESKIIEKKSPWKASRFYQKMPKSNSILLQILILIHGAPVSLSLFSIRWDLLFPIDDDLSGFCFFVSLNKSGHEVIKKTDTGALIELVFPESFRLPGLAEIALDQCLAIRIFEIVYEIPV